jgi:AGCS family alanine or glycine:cation symporter
VIYLLDILDNALWGYIALPAILILGSALTFQSKFVQLRKFPAVVRIFLQFLMKREHTGNGVHPLKAFFACVGGCTGIGNLVAICTAVQLGGPGALFWIWMTAIAGSIVKYAEVYLGIRYRVSNNKGGYHGGPMYFLQRVFKSAWIPKFAALLLCIYGVEVYQFSVIADSLTTNLEVNKTVIVMTLLVLVVGASIGGVHRVGQISSMMIPGFILIYLGMGAWIFLQNLHEIPGVFHSVFASAFTGHAAIGGFAGSGLLLTISQGLRRGCYAGDVGVGYASVIHSETGETQPERQASLAIFDIFVDSFMICTTSVLLVLVTGVWHQPLDATLLVQTALGYYFPYMEFFMPLFLFLLGYTTIIAYFCAGIKCAEHLAPTHGRRLYFVYAALALFAFSFIDTSQALIIMSITGGLLLVLNIYAIFILRHEISYAIPS